MFYAQAATVYSWVDETGDTHFSDIPRDGAKEIDVKTYSMGTSMAQNTTSSHKMQSKGQQNSDRKGPMNNSSDGQLLPTGDSTMPPPPSS